MLEPKQLHNIAHPLIEEIYLKREFGKGGRPKENDVLVIQTRRGIHMPDRGGEHLLLSFLADLDLIRDEVESKAGKFSRIDIRCH